MRVPVFTFQDEVRTDAPFAHIQARLQAGASPWGFRALGRLGAWECQAGEGGALRLQQDRRWAGAEARLRLTIREDGAGAHLHLEGRIRGWAGFLGLGRLRWQADGLLVRFVEDL